MSTPRQEFLGPITKLAATYLNGSWVSDGYGIIDGYGAEFHNATMVLNARDTQPTTGVDKGSFWVDGSVSPTIPRFTNSNGDTIELGTGGGVPVGPENQVYWSDGVDNAWTGNPIVNGLVATTYVSIGAFGAGSLTFSAYLTTPPVIQQDPINAVGSGQGLIISAQGNGTDPGMFGGHLVLRGGAGWSKGLVELSGSRIYLDSKDLTFRAGFGDQVISMDNIFQASTTAAALTIEAGCNSHASGTGGDLNLMGGLGGSANGNVVLQTPTGILGVGADNLTISKASYGTTVQSSYTKLVGLNNSNYGSAAIIPSAYNQSASHIPRMDKQFGTFRLTGTAETYTITFSTAIHGVAMPVDTVLVGRFMIGWMGNGSYTNGGAMQFMYTVTSNVSGNILRFYSSLSDNYVIPGGSSVLTSGSAPSSTTADCEYTLPTDAHTPLLTVAIPADPTTAYSFTFQATYNGAPANFANYFWENEYGWGSNT